MGDLKLKETLKNLLQRSSTSSVKTPTITKTSGAGNVTSVQYYECAGIGQLRIGMSSTTSIASGANAFIGTLEEGYRPINRIVNNAYYGAYNFAIDINTNGGITVRNASASAVTLTNGIMLSAIYIVGG